MSTWVIISWIFVAILTGINIFIFIKLKDASEQMMKMAFPGSKNMGEAMAQMQKMMGSMNRGPAQPGQRGGGHGQQQQLQQAMEMLRNMQQGKKK
jgi:hypothetical protein